MITSINFVHLFEMMVSDSIYTWLCRSQFALSASWLFIGKMQEWFGSTSEVLFLGSTICVGLNDSNVSQESMKSIAIFWRDLEWLEGL